MALRISAWNPLDGDRVFSWGGNLIATLQQKHTITFHMTNVNSSLFELLFGTEEENDDD